jgi:Fe-S-cluster containining protein
MQPQEHFELIIDHAWTYMPKHLKLLNFRCTGCGNCCRDPLLPLTDADLGRIVDHTSLPAAEVVKWVSSREIDLAHDDANFVLLRAGRRAMVLRHMRGRCRFLGSDDRCNIYSARPLGCRIFPFDPTFDRNHKLLRLRMIQATDCPYESDGKNDVRQLRRLHRETERELAEYHTKVEKWNREQTQRMRSGHAPLPASAFLRHLGFEVALATFETR